MDEKQNNLKNRPRWHTTEGYETSRNHPTSRFPSHGADATASIAYTTVPDQFLSLESVWSGSHNHSNAVHTSVYDHTQTSTSLESQRYHSPRQSYIPQVPAQQHSYPCSSDYHQDQPQYPVISQMSTEETSYPHGGQHKSTYQARNTLRPVAASTSYHDYAMGNIHSLPGTMVTSRRHQSNRPNDHDMRLGGMIDGTTRLSMEDNRGPHEMKHAAGWGADSLGSDQRSLYGSHIARPAGTNANYPILNGDTYVVPYSLPGGDLRFLGRSSAGTFFTQPSPQPAYNPLASGPPVPSHASSSNHKSTLSDESTVSALHCKHCGKIVSRAKDPSHRKSNLARHIRTEHKDAPRVLCPEADCDKSFKRSDALRKHQKKEHDM